MSEPADLERMGIPTVSDLEQWTDASGRVLRCSSGYSATENPGVSHDDWHVAHPHAALEARRRATAAVTRMAGG